MRRTIELDGDEWTVEGFLGVDAARRAAARVGDAPRAAAIPASVPGSILDDVARAGLVPDPYVGLNSLAAEWVPERAWLYRCVVRAPALGDTERAWLSFDGLDHAGEVFWDGASLGRHEGMFVPFDVDLTPQLRVRDGVGSEGATGLHELAVVIDSAPPSEAQLERTSLVRHHKSRMGYGWDFAPRMIHQGLWQSVRLEVAGAIRIADVWARPRLSRDLRSATVEVDVALDVLASNRVRVEARLEGESSGSAEVVAEVEPGASTLRLAFEVERPVLWWPNGLGRPVVHRLAVRALGAERELEDERAVPLGFRTIERAPNDGAPADARPWTWLVNGRRLYVKGWNWVPIDAQYGVPRQARLDHLIRLARDANVNLLRAWGGGLIETRAFYEACDAAGILVWQEFAQSSSLTDSVPADDAEFVGRMAREAEAIVPLRRNHPSLALWCGGNELEGPDGPLDDTTPVLGALREVVERLDPGRAWLPTSPSGPRFANRLDVIEADPDGLHDVHGPWEHQGLRAQHELYDRGTSLFNSEFGVEGMTNRRTHERLISESARWPATRANPVYRHLGDWWNNEPLVQEAFGGRLRDLESLRRASQHLQADGLRYGIEANRRRAFRNSGSIPWQLNESYPNAWCTSAVDHRGDPKPAYFAVRRAYAPVVAAAAFASVAWGGAAPFEADLWAWSDTGPVEGTFVARLLDLDGAVLTEVREAAAPGDEPVRVGRIERDGPLPGLFLLDLALLDAKDSQMAQNRYVCSGGEDLGTFLVAPAATLAVDVAIAPVDVAIAPADARAGDAWAVRLANVGRTAALGIRLEDDRPIDAPGWAEAEDGWFDLLPGERRSIGVRWADANPNVPRRLRLSAWNVADQVVEPT